MLISPLRTEVPNVGSLGRALERGCAGAARRFAALVFALASSWIFGGTLPAEADARTSLTQSASRSFDTISRFRGRVGRAGWLESGRAGLDLKLRLDAPGVNAGSIDLTSASLSVKDILRDSDGTSLVSSHEAETLMATRGSRSHKATFRGGPRSSAKAQVTLREGRIDLKLKLDRLTIDPPKACLDGGEVADLESSLTVIFANGDTLPLRISLPWRCKPMRACETCMEIRADFRSSNGSGGGQNGAPRASIRTNNLTREREKLNWIELDARGSRDVDGTLTKYVFRVVSEKTGEVLSAPAARNAPRSFVELSPGLYRVAVTVTDDQGNTATDTRRLSISGEPIDDFDRFGVRWAYSPDEIEGAPRYRIPPGPTHLDSIAKSFLSSSSASSGKKRSGVLGAAAGCGSLLSKTSDGLDIAKETMSFIPYAGPVFGVAGTVTGMIGGDASSNCLANELAQMSSIIAEQTVALQGIQAQLDLTDNAIYDLQLQESETNENVAAQNYTASYQKLVPNGSDPSGTDFKLWMDAIGLFNGDAPCGKIVCPATGLTITVPYSATPPASPWPTTESIEEGYNLTLGSWTNVYTLAGVKAPAKEANTELYSVVVADPASDLIKLYVAQAQTLASEIGDTLDTNDFASSKNTNLVGLFDQYNAATTAVYQTSLQAVQQAFLMMFTQNLLNFWVFTLPTTETYFAVGKQYGAGSNPANCASGTQPVFQFSGDNFLQVNDLDAVEATPYFNCKNAYNSGATTEALMYENYNEAQRQLTLFFGAIANQLYLNTLNYLYTDAPLAPQGYPGQVIEACLGDASMPCSDAATAEAPCTATTTALPFTSTALGGVTLKPIDYAGEVGRGLLSLADQSQITNLAVSPTCQLEMADAGFTANTTGLPWTANGALYQYNGIQDAQVCAATVSESQGNASVSLKSLISPTNANPSATSPGTCPAIMLDGSFEAVDQGYWDGFAVRPYTNLPELPTTSCTSDTDCMTGQQCVGAIAGVKDGICLSVDVDPSGTECAGNWGSIPDTPVCCGQQGPVDSYSCPADYPICVGYVYDQTFGSCVKSQDGVQLTGALSGSQDYYDYDSASWTTGSSYPYVRNTSPGTAGSMVPPACGEDQNLFWYAPSSDCASEPAQLQAGEVYLMCGTPNVPATNYLQQLSAESSPSDGWAANGSSSASRLEAMQWGPFWSATQGFGGVDCGAMAIAAAAPIRIDLDDPSAETFGLGGPSRCIEDLFCIDPKDEAELLYSIIDGIGVLASSLSCQADFGVAVGSVVDTLLSDKENNEGVYISSSDLVCSSEYPACSLSGASQESRCTTYKLSEGAASFYDHADDKDGDAALARWMVEVPSQSPQGAPFRLPLLSSQQNCRKGSPSPSPDIGLQLIPGPCWVQDAVPGDETYCPSTLTPGSETFNGATTYYGTLSSIPQFGYQCSPTGYAPSVQTTGMASYIPSSDASGITCSLADGRNIQWAGQAIWTTNPTCINLLDPIRTNPAAQVASGVTCRCDSPGSGSPNNGYSCSDRAYNAYCASDQVCSSSERWVYPNFPCD